MPAAKLWINWKNPGKCGVLGIKAVDKGVENVDYRAVFHVYYSRTFPCLYRKRGMYGLKFYKITQDLLVWKHFF